MSNKVIALRGISNVGKSKTIGKVYELLISKYPHHQKEHDRQLMDISVIIIINGVRIGIEGQGDPSGRLDESLSLFVKERCKVIICATRTRGQTVAAVTNMTKHNFEVIWFEQVASVSSKHDASNLAMAKLIIEEAEKYFNT